MKSLNFMAVLSLLLFLVSCGGGGGGVNLDKLTLENFLGTYSMKSFESSKIEFIKIDEDLQPIKVSTKRLGSVFEMDYDFRENNRVVVDGTFWVKESKKQENEEPVEKQYTERINNESQSYILDTDARTLMLGIKKYSIRDFSRAGFTLHLNTKDEDTGNQNNEIIDFARK